MTVGDDASSAIQRFDWNGDELFVLASSRGGVLRRVFLGDMTYKLVRATPVPALVLPRRTWAPQSAPPGADTSRCGRYGCRSSAPGECSRPRSSRPCSPVRCSVHRLLPPTVLLWPAVSIRDRGYAAMVVDGDTLGLPTPATGRPTTTR